MNVVAIIQARMSSTRLPGKVMRDIAGQSMLSHAVRRTQSSSRVNEVVVATTVESSDDIIVEECRRIGVAVFRGSHDDVLDRYFRAAVLHQADAIVRITSDCPLTDPALVDEHVRCLEERWQEVDFVTKLMRETFPLGLAVEVMPFDVLARMQRMTTTPQLREHVTTLAYVKPEWFVVDHVLNDTNLASMRWTVDTLEDLELVRNIFTELGPESLSWRDALRAFNQHPEWQEINRHVRQKSL